eukprot:TRINITY_DN1407_c0_g1_i3.p1 TRINITY_DN1407_c0_g1~~TRINITY_DN1407_c0_g1_i3.p1  ORF type:complete len:226 (+),score=55.42 TRINITY_DN1407_c0_g1_i3:209-886(+)
MKQVAILLAVAAVAFAAPTNQCASAIQAAGVSTRFDETIAHAIHSITLNELQKFNPTATAQNGVPTVNRAIAGLPADKVVADAPQLNIPGDFETEAMNLFDLTLAHATDHSDGLGDNWNPLERVAHIFHMRDLWARVRKEYSVTSNVTETACACLKDTENNGIKARLLWIAQEYTHDTPISLHEWGTKIPALTLATWPEWKKRLSYYYDSQSIKDAAVYLQCALN